MDKKPREKLIDAATALFSEHGFHAVGVNSIIAGAGVAKKTLYRYFPSKEDLIVAVLEACDQKLRAMFRAEVEAKASDGEGKILAFFDVAHAWFESDRFFGCLFISAACEYGDRQPEIRHACQSYKNGVRAFLQDLCFQAGLVDPLALGDRLFMLFEGATVMAQGSGDAGSAHIAKDTAAVLLTHGRDGD